MESKLNRVSNEIKNVRFVPVGWLLNHLQKEEGKGMNEKRSIFLIAGVPRTIKLHNARDCCRRRRIRFQLLKSRLTATRVGPDKIPRDLSSVNFRLPLLKFWHAEHVKKNCVFCRVLE
jgi:hypothetical protein